MKINWKAVGIAVAVVLVAVVAYFLLGCEQVDNAVQPESSNFGSAEKISGLVSGTEALPSELKWWWRRIQLDGDLSTNGANNINGTALGLTSNVIDYGNLSFETVWSGDTIPKYWAYAGTGISGSRSSSHHLGSYSGHIWITASGAGAGHFATSSSGTGGDFYDTGQTMFAGDTVTLSCYYKKIGGNNTTNPSQPVIMIEKVGGSYAYTNSYLNYFSNTSSWSYHDLTNPAIIPSGWNAYGKLKLSKTLWWSGEGERTDVYVDDMRVYSSASQLPPAAQVHTPDEWTYNPEGHTLACTVDLGTINASGNFDISFYYEDPVTGLYHLAATWDTRTNDGTSWDYEGTLTSAAQSEISANGSLDVRTATKASGYEVHINELEGFTIEGE